MSLIQHQAFCMLELQTAMNCKVNPEWLDAGYPFLRAIVVEGAEGMEHHGWKWWKAQSPDVAQLQMELVDIWHFMLSDFIIKAKGILTYATTIVVSESAKNLVSIVFDGIEYRISDMDTISKIELVIGLSVARRTSIPLFKSLLADCGMEWDDLFRQYVAKNVLNMFRQDFGYKQGTYRKIWDGREDNQHLVELLAEHNADNPEFKDRLYEGLRQRYFAAAV